MNGLILKIIALITMMIDHYGAIFHEGVNIYRIIGRLAFPIYCFLLVEGFVHTRDLKKYAIRIFIFALLSELPFDLAFYGKLGFQHQNIFFTLFIGLIAMYFLDTYNTPTKRLLVVYITSVAASVLEVDYSFIGIIYIMAFYSTRKLTKKKRLPIVGLIIFIVNFLSMATIQQYALLALPILYFYNGRSGFKNKAVQILFYAAYPLHLLVYYFMNR